MGAHLQSEDQFTIFYSGSVNVYHHVSPHKARAIMLLLSDHHNSDSGVAACTPDSSSMLMQPPLLRSKSVEVGCAKAGYSSPPHPSAPSTRPTMDNTQTIQCALQKQRPVVIKRSQAELPFARKASLTRFLEKRKDRALETMKVNRSDVSGPTCADGSVDALDSSSKRMKF